MESFLINETSLVSRDGYINREAEKGALGASFRNILRPAHACAVREGRPPSPLLLVSSAAAGSPLTRRECERQPREHAPMSLQWDLPASHREAEEPESRASSAWRVHHQIAVPGFRRSRRRGPCACHLVVLQAVDCQRAGYWMMVRQPLAVILAQVYRQEGLALHECERAPLPMLLYVGNMSRVQSKRPTRAFKDYYYIPACSAASSYFRSSPSTSSRSPKYAGPWLVYFL